MLRNLLIAPPFLFGIAMGLMALFAPDRISTILGVTAIDAAGRGTIVGDFAALFLTGAGCMALAVMRGKTGLLWIPVALFGITFLGRIVAGLTTGFGPGAGVPMIVEAVLIALLLGAIKLSPTPR